MKTNDLLKVLKDTVPRDERRIHAMPMLQSNELSSESILSPGLRELFGSNASDDDSELQRVAEQLSEFIDDVVMNDTTSDRAAGALVGLAIGDAVGAPLEFRPARNEAECSTGPRLLRSLHPETGELQYREPFNKFKLLAGQWTDDCSMALCLADSLIARGDFDGSDCRVRWYDWWNFGYNNAFRFDERPNRTSVGLGDNVSMSLDAVADHTGQLASAVPSRYTSEGDDAGNGSIMRLAPVPIRFHRNLHKAMQIAEAQSYASHPGSDAADCCAVMTYMIANAIQRPAADSRTMGEFMCDQTHKFLKEHSPLPSFTDNTETNNLASLLSSNPPTDSEAVWAWREPHPLVKETLLARGESYNGHDVTSVYFGSYCMDGLAMAMWALHGSKNFADCMIRIVNLLGDADTTGAIAGQIAGAFYGYKAFDSDPISSRMLSNLRRWDPLHEIPLRALLLNDDSLEIVC